MTDNGTKMLMSLDGLRNLSVIADRAGTHSALNGVLFQWCAQAEAEIRRLRAERDALREDAERYRWLKQNRSFCVASYPDGEWTVPAGMVLIGTYDDADARIDAARKGEASEKGK
jgi:hypothetical protein